jgi:hypothetical protein
MSICSVDNSGKLTEAVWGIEIKLIWLTDSLSLETQPAETINIGSWGVDAELEKSSRTINKIEVGESLAAIYMTYFLPAAILSNVLVNFEPKTLIPLCSKGYRLAVI